MPKALPLLAGNASVVPNTFIVVHEFVEVHSEVELTRLAALEAPDLVHRPHRRK